jgi:hypothetical protein
MADVISRVTSDRSIGALSKLSTVWIHFVAKDFRKDR